MLKGLSSPIKMANAASGIGALNSSLNTPNGGRMPKLRHATAMSDQVGSGLALLRELLQDLLEHLGGIILAAALGALAGLAALLRLHLLHRLHELLDHAHRAAAAAHHTHYAT
jgi:hypothetical protein